MLVHVVTANHTEDLWMVYLDLFILTDKINIAISNEVPSPLIYI